MIRNEIGIPSAAHADHLRDEGVRVDAEVAGRGNSDHAGGGIQLINGLIRRFQIGEIGFGIHHQLRFVEDFIRVDLSFVPLQDSGKEILPVVLARPPQRREAGIGHEVIFLSVRAGDVAVHHPSGQGPADAGPRILPIAEGCAHQDVDAGKMILAHKGDDGIRVGEIEFSLFRLQQSPGEGVPDFGDGGAGIAEGFREFIAESHSVAIEAVLKPPAEMQTGSHPIPLLRRGGRNRDTCNVGGGLIRKIPIPEFGAALCRGFFRRGFIGAGCDSRLKRMEYGVHAVLQAVKRERFFLRNSRCQIEGEFLRFLHAVGIEVVEGEGHRRVLPGRVVRDSDRPSLRVSDSDGPVRQIEGDFERRGRLVRGKGLSLFDLNIVDPDGAVAIFRIDREGVGDKIPFRRKREGVSFPLCRQHHLIAPLRHAETGFDLRDIPSPCGWGNNGTVLIPVGRHHAGAHPDGTADRLVAFRIK